MCFPQKDVHGSYLGQTRIFKISIQNLQARAARKNFEKICRCARSAQNFEKKLQVRAQRAIFFLKICTQQPEPLACLDQLGLALLDTTRSYLGLGFVRGLGLGLGLVRVRVGVRVGVRVRVRVTVGLVRLRV